MAYHNELGKWGERKAIEYLEDKGYKILAHDWKSKRRDLDIVAAVGGKVVFVEVRTKRNDVFISPERSLMRKKLMSFYYAANAFMRRYDITCETRFDVITVIGTCDDDYFEIEHIEDAFLPPTI